MLFKTIKDPIMSSDIYYDLFDGGYIKPKVILKDRADIKKVEEAIRTIKDFLNSAEDAGIIELI